MARNGVIVGWAAVVVVIEAGEKGGTLDAGRRALAAGRRVLVLDIDGPQTVGNRMLLDEGAEPVRSPQDLEARFRGVQAAPVAPVQTSLL